MLNIWKIMKLDIYSVQSNFLQEQIDTKMFKKFQQKET